MFSKTIQVHAESYGATGLWNDTTGFGASEPLVVSEGDVLEVRAL